MPVPSARFEAGEWAMPGATHTGTPGVPCGASAPSALVLGRTRLRTRWGHA